MSEHDPYRAPEARIAATMPEERLAMAPAGRWRRFFNWVIDHATLKVFWWCVGMSYVAWCTFRGDDPHDAVWRYEHLSFGWRFASGLVATGTYYLLMETFFGFTIGKLATGTRVVDERGERPSSRQLLIRTAMGFVPLEPISAFGEKGSEPLPWHDTVAKTRVARRRR